MSPNQSQQDATQKQYREAVDHVTGDQQAHPKRLVRDDGEIFSQNEDGTYTMDKQREEMPTTYYRYTYEKLMKSGAFSPGTSENAEAQFEYKCRRCGQIYRNPCCSPYMARGILMQVIFCGSGGSVKKGGKVYPLASHLCKDGGEGIADLQGYRIV